MLAPGDPLPDLGEALRELGGEERVGVDRRQPREQRLVVRHEPETGSQFVWLLSKGLNNDSKDTY